MTLYRTVRVVTGNGRAYDVPLTAEQAAFYLRLAEYKAATNQPITFGDLLVAKREKEMQRKRR
jgi:hypothetical protein